MDFLSKPSFGSTCLLGGLVFLILALVGSFTFPGGSVTIAVPPRILAGIIGVLLVAVACYAVFGDANSRKRTVAAEQIGQQSATGARENIEPVVSTAGQFFFTLDDKIAEVRIRVTKHAPTLSIILVEKRDQPRSHIQVQLYFLHSAIGRDRPIFRVHRTDKWYPMFEAEFTKLWNDAKNRTVSELLTTITNLT